MKNKYFALDIDDFVEKLHGHLAMIQDGGAGHYCRMDAETNEEATEELIKRLRPFIQCNFYQSDDYGYREPEDK